MKRGVALLILFGALLVGFSSAQESRGATMPEGLDDFKKIGERFLDVVRKDLPGIITGIWKKEVLPFWQKMGDWFKENIFDPYINPFFKKEIEPRGPVIEEEFEKEKEELKEDIKTEMPEAGRSIWERIQDLIK